MSDFVLIMHISIMERLRGLGYTEDDYPVDNKDWDKLTYQPKALTDRSKCEILFPPLMLIRIQMSSLE